MRAFLLSFAVGVVMLSATFSPVCALEYPELIGYVNDFANLLTKEDRGNLEGLLRTFEKQTSIELVVVTTPSLEGYPIDAYTLDLANTWNVGKDGKNNGIVLLYVADERKIQVEIGRGFGSVFTLDTAQKIIEKRMFPYFRSGHISEGIVWGTKGIVRYFEEREANKFSFRKLWDSLGLPEMFLLLDTIILILFIGACSLCAYQYPKNQKVYELVNQKFRAGPESPYREWGRELREEHWRDEWTSEKSEKWQKEWKDVKKQQLEWTKERDREKKNLLENLKKQEFKMAIMANDVSQIPTVTIAILLISLIVSSFMGINSWFMSIMGVLAIMVGYIPALVDDRSNIIVPDWLQITFFVGSMVVLFLLSIIPTIINLYLR